MVEDGEDEDGLRRCTIRDVAPLSLHQFTDNNCVCCEKSRITTLFLVTRIKPRATIFKSRVTIVRLSSTTKKNEQCQLLTTATP